MTSRVTRFEDLIAWQKSMDIAVETYQLTRSQPFARDFALCDQIHRSVISIPSNIAEGFERGTRPEFHHFLSIAKGSCAELRTQLMLAQRIGYIEDEAADEVLGRAEEVSRVIGGLLSSVAKQRRTPKTQ